MVKYSLMNRLGKLFIFIISAIIFGFSCAGKVSADNKFGIHILEPAEVSKATELVNSSGGDWGYVTFVLREDDLDGAKWQQFFDDCRRFHLIPIARLATKMNQAGFWERPTIEGLEKWPAFLNSLNWPTKQQIVVLFNEPNHAKEVGGELNPEYFAQVSDQLIDLFHRQNSNFLVLNAGFDQAAGNSRDTLEETSFLSRMNSSVPGIFNKFDGWASHSYPNHGFVGLPSDTQRGSIKGYEWELEFLKTLGVDKDLPIFITETGWPHKEDSQNLNGFYNQNKVAEFFQEAFELWQKDDRVKAVTPFVLNYPVAPFANFSWLRQDGSSYPQYDRVLGIAKEKSEPEQVRSFTITKLKVIDFLPADYVFKGKVVIKNTGQWIMGERGEFELKLDQPQKDGLKISGAKISQGDLLFPGDEKELDLIIETGSKSEEYQFSVDDQQHTIYVFKPWELKNQEVSLWQQIKTKIKLWWYEFRER